MDRFMEMMNGKHVAIQAAQAFLPIISVFAAEHGWEVQSNPNWFCIRIGLGRRAVSVSWCKKMEWGPDTESIELALFDHIDGKMIFDEEAGYEDLRIFDGIDEVNDELLRLYNYFHHEDAQAEDK